MRNILRPDVAAIALVLALSTLPAAAAPQESKAPPGKIGSSEAVMVRATVEAIDSVARTVTLKGPRGKTFAVSVDDKVTNLSGVKVGDEVLATYFEAVSFELKKPGEAVPGKSVAEGAAAPGAGGSGPGVGSRQVKVVATIEAIDPRKGTVTLKGPDGKSVEVKARDPKNLRRVKVGDLVEITHTEALAISIKPAPKPPPKK
jgi:hypothetical protein